MVELKDLYTVYFKARKNKRRSEDAVLFEIDYERRLYNLCNAINEKTYRADKNYAFISLRPKPREVFACELESRIIQWYIVWRILPILESTLSPRCYNNRKGMGTDAAIEQLRDNIIKVSHNFTRPAYVIQWDLQGYFPNAVTEIAREQLQKLVIENYDGEDKEDLLWMILISVNALPQKHCYRKSPRDMWSLIEYGKSLFDKEDGIGGAIGFLIWQIAMNLYLNDVDHWAVDEMGLEYLRFVDDSSTVVENKEAALTLMPLFRAKYEAVGCRMHPKKFSCQDVTKNIKFLGSYIKFDRIYVNSRTIRSAEARIRAFNRTRNIRKNSEAFRATLNSYFGLLKRRSELNNIVRLYNLIDKKWLQAFTMDWGRLCLVANEGYTHKDYLIYKTTINQK